MINKVLNQLYDKYSSLKFEGEVTLFFCKEFYEYMLEVFSVDYVFTNNDYEIIKDYFTINNRSKYNVNNNINELYDCFDNKDFYEMWKTFKKYEYGYITLKLQPNELEIYFNEELLYNLIGSYLFKKLKNRNIVTKYDLIEILYNEKDGFCINCVGIYTLETIYNTYVNKETYEFDNTIYKSIKDEYKFKAKKNDSKWERKNQLKYMNHIIGKHKSFAIDIIFLSNYSYLLLININTRKIYCKCLNMIILNNFIKFKKPNSYTTGDIIKIINDIDIKHIYCDNDTVFTSNIFKEYCKRRNITIETIHINKYNNSSYQIHGLLSILDRSVRTIRKYLYNAGDPDPNPYVIDKLINYYNNKSHKGIRNIIKMNVTPNQIDNDIRLEKLLVEKACKNNLINRITTNYILNPGTNVKVYKPIDNNKSQFEKRPTSFFPGIWTVIEHKRLVKVRDNNGNEMEVPRWHLVKI